MLKFRDPRFAGYDKKTGIRFPPKKVTPDSYIEGKHGPIPVFKLIPVDDSRYPGHVLREIRKTHR